MAPLPPSPTPRVVVYHQTHHINEQPVSIIPLIPHCTHVILAAIHLNDPPGHLTLNNHLPTHPRNQTLWAEVHLLRNTGLKILGLLGGAARGSFARLDADAQTFESHYQPLRDLIRSKQLDGLDLDVEEPMTLAGIIRLIDRLRADFGPAFLITLAPVAAALISARPEHNLSGFDYEALEVYRGGEIAWYNTQFYCGWGDISTTRGYEAIVGRGFPPEKIVIGMVTNGANGEGWVDLAVVQEVLASLRTTFGSAFGGVMGWEYYNSLPGGEQRPWEWAAAMKTAVMGRAGPPDLPPRMPNPFLMSMGGGSQHAVVGNRTVVESSNTVVDKKHIGYVVEEDDAKEASLPASFEYFTDGSVEE